MSAAQASVMYLACAARHCSLIFGLLLVRALGMAVHESPVEYCGSSVMNSNFCCTVCQSAYA